jgi:hypothetical protein
MWWTQVLEGLSHPFLVNFGMVYHWVDHILLFGFCSWKGLYNINVFVQWRRQNFQKPLSGTLSLCWFRLDRLDQFNLSCSSHLRCDRMGAAAASQRWRLGGLSSLPGTQRPSANFQGT